MMTERSRDPAFVMEEGVSDIGVEGKIVECILRYDETKNAFLHDISVAWAPSALDGGDGETREHRPSRHGVWGVVDGVEDPDEGAEERLAENARDSFHRS